MENDELVFNDKVHKILIVDDEKETLEALRLTLENADEFKSEINLAEDGNTALKKLKKQDFDLILSDFKMPNMNGITLLNKIREEYPNMVRILITAYSDFSLMRKAVNQVDVDHFIEKPWHNDELILIIASALKVKRENELKSLSCR